MIEGFANFVMGGSVLLGLVVFCVLLIVNFIVITKGATRMAEVGARFALDGMPGKQLAIDSDMSAGAIDHAEAKARRETEQAETTFFGSLDGASKFVKGDAVAGLLITMLNIVMGLVMGVAVHGMDIGHAFETYAILTVGDGLVSQIPAVVISIASAFFWRVVVQLDLQILPCSPSWAASGCIGNRRRFDGPICIGSGFAVPSVCIRGDCFGAGRMDGA